MYAKLLRLFKAFQRDGLAGVFGFLQQKYLQIHYENYLAKEIVNSENVTENIKFSILVPVYKTQITYLQAVIDSVLAQNYRNWELCLVDDNSNDPKIDLVINDYQANDLRIKYLKLNKSSHIATTTNAALKLATGVYVCFLDHDDVLAVDALKSLAIAAHNNYDIIYSDEDNLNSNLQRFNPYFKTNFDPILLLSQNYMCHFLAVKRELALQIGFDSECNGAQDWDFILRLIAKIDSDKIYHVPKILYHWRYHANSTAANISAKPYAIQAQVKAVEKYINQLELKILNVDFDLVDQVPRLSIKADQVLNIFILSDNPYSVSVIELQNRIESYSWNVEVGKEIPLDSEDYNLILALSESCKILSTKYLKELLALTFLPDVTVVSGTRVTSDKKIFAAGYESEKEIIPIYNQTPSYSRGYFNILKLPHAVPLIDSNFMATRFSKKFAGLAYHELCKHLLQADGYQIIEPRFHFTAVQDCLSNDLIRKHKTYYNSNLSPDRQFKLL